MVQTPVGSDSRAYAFNPILYVHPSKERPYCALIFTHHLCQVFPILMAGQSSLAYSSHEK